MQSSILTPELLLRAYRAGVFPMAERRDDPDLYWLDPEKRGVIPLDGFHLSRRLRRTVLGDSFAVTVDHAFEAVIDGCADDSAAEPAGGRAGPAPRGDTWINGEIRHLFVGLHRMGHAHSVECWQDGVLAGGLYGMAIGAAFFGESMFSRRRDASKVALAHLVARLRLGGFTLLDTQFVNPHLLQFGATEISRAEYRRRLADALERPAVFEASPDPVLLRAALETLGRDAGAAGS